MWYNSGLVKLIVPVKLTNIVIVLGIEQICWYVAILVIKLRGVNSSVIGILILKFNTESSNRCINSSIKYPEPKKFGSDSSLKPVLHFLKDVF